MNKYLFIHKFQILKKYAQEIANKKWQVLNIDPEGKVSPPHKKNVLQKNL